MLTMIVGCKRTGWVLGETAERMAVSRFMQQPNAAEKLKALPATDTWRQREFVEAGGWATSGEAKAPNSGVATAGAEQLSRTKT